MKKSFMTRVLATGLSLAMAFSLSAATNVTTASAAVKKASTTTFMKVATKNVTEGKTTTTYMNSTATKKYRIKSHTESSVAKKYISVVMTSSRKGLKITAKDGAVTNAGLEKKGVNVKINFAAAKSVAAVKKAKATKYVNLKVAVKAAEDEKLTLTAEATHVKEIVVTANKAFADPTKVKATVKKGTADRGATATVEGSKITLAMDAKLTKGSYTITVEGAEDTPITVPCEVAQDETLTTFEISDYIVAKSVSETTTGAIKYAALNQYGDKMTANEPTVTCSFGKVLNQKPKKPATATAEGEIEVTDINPVLAIVGTKGTVVLVGEMGVTATKEISYNTFAKATTAEVAGTYHKNSASLKSITEGDTITDYELLLTFKDQYGYSMDASELAGVKVTVTGGLTNISASGNTANFTTRTLNGVDYVAVPLNATKKAAAGDATLIVVNDYYGMLINDKISVAKNVVIKNMTITADNGVYDNQDNEMGYEFTDAEGKSVTSYATLKNCVDLDGATTGLRFEQKSDGTAKLIYNPTSTVTPNQTTDKASLPATVTVKANSQTGGDYLVKTFTFTVYQERVAKGVTGIAADTVTSISKKGAKLEIGSDKLVLADQYSNKVTSTEKYFNKKLFDGASDGTTTGTAVYIATNGAFDTAVDTTNNKIIATPSAIGGTATVYLKYAYTKFEDGTTPVVTASATNYDAKFTITAYDTTGVDVSTLEIDSVNGGFDMTEASAGAISVSDIVVKALVGGVKTVIPTEQYTIVKNENNKFSGEDDQKGLTKKTAKVTVQVTTWDSVSTPISTQISKEYTVSKEDAKLFKVTDAVATATADISSGVTASGSAVSAAAFVKNFNFKTQFGKVETGASTTVTGSAVKYTIEVLSATGEGAKYEILHNGLNQAQIKFIGLGTYKYKVTATTDDGSSKFITATVTINS